MIYFTKKTSNQFKFNYKTAVFILKLNKDCFLRKIRERKKNVI